MDACAVLTFPVDPNDRAGEKFTLHLHPITPADIERVRATHGDDLTRTLFGEALARAVDSDGITHFAPNLSAEGTWQALTEDDQAQAVAAAIDLGHQTSLVDRMLERLTTDPMFALTMDYCAQRGIPYTTFLGWDPPSRDAALAWQARVNARCGSCGQVKADWMVDGPDGPIEADPPPMVVAEHWCPGCEAHERRRRNHKDLPPGISHRFVPFVHPAPEPGTEGRSEP